MSSVKSKSRSINRKPRNYLSNASRRDAKREANVAESPGPENVTPVDNLDNANQALTELASLINASHNERLECYRNALDHAIAVGQRLLEAKKISREAFGHGHWTDWVKNNCRFDIRTAQLYMKIAKYLDAMPDLQAVMHKKRADDGYRLEEALDWLKDKYRTRFDEQELKEGELSTALDNALNEAAEVLIQVKLRLGDEAWARYSVGLGKPRTTVVTFLTAPENQHPEMIALPEKLPQRFEAGRDQDGRPVYVVPHEQDGRRIYVEPHEQDGRRIYVEPHELVADVADDDAAEEVEEAEEDAAAE